MTPLIIIALRTLAASVVALAAWMLARRQSAAVRHVILACGIVATAAVVPLSFLLPDWNVIPTPSPAVFDAGATASADDRGPIGVATNGASGASVQAVPSAPLSPFVIVASAWAFVGISGLVLLAARLRRLAQLTTAAVPIVDGEWRSIASDTATEFGLDRHVEIRRTAAPDIVATWGLRAPVVLVPTGSEGWDPSWIRVVLRHELAHVVRRDWATQIVSDVVRSVLWFNPLIWTLCSSLRRESECACDDLVLRSGVPVHTYASHLIDIARACRGGSNTLPALPVAGPSTLERRITMLLNADRDRRQPPVWAVSLIFGCMLVAAGVVASIGVFAQTATGTLVGRVFDPSGAVLPAVEVVLENEQKTQWPTMTDSTGRFEFTPVGAGKYTLRASLPGFRSLSDQFELRDPKNWNRIVTLQVGELEETIQVTAKRPAQSAAAAAPSGPVRIGGNIKPPVKLVNVPPVYPASLRDQGLEGVVRMEALLAQDGSVTSVRMLSAQVHPEFARSAETAVRQWRFSQTLLNGVAVEVRMTVSIAFNLTD